MTLKQWRKANRYNRPAFLKLAAKRGLQITVQTLYNWERGHTVPDTIEAEVIRKLTDEQVLPSSFKRKVAPP